VPETEQQLLAGFRDRIDQLDQLSRQLEDLTREALTGIERIDRISFRRKDEESFAKKALKEDQGGVRKYQSPFREIEDQVAGRVIVFFLSDLEPVKVKLRDAFGAVEDVRKEPASPQEFDYESDHLVFPIPGYKVPEAWAGRHDVPVTFEMQVRTLFQHAWAEPQHDVGYKGRELERDQLRELAWVAASAWGADHALDRVWQAVRPN
jgi:putative GTP pyrophosphokinase